MNRPIQPFPTRDHGDILYVEFIDERPHSVFTTEGGYDFSWCKRDNEVLFHDSGGGIGRNNRFELCQPNGLTFWVADCIDVRIKDAWDDVARKYTVDIPATEEELAKRGMTRVPVLGADLFDDAHECTRGIAYCSICDDHFDEDATCVHVWTGLDGVLLGPGSNDDECKGEGCKDVFVEFMAVAGIMRGYRKGLEPYTIRTSQRHALGGLGPSYVHVYRGKKDLGDIGGKFDQYDDRLQDGAQWLFCLGEDTPDAIARTAAWLDEAIAAQDKRRASYERTYVVTDGYRYATTKRKADRNDPKFTNAKTFATRRQPKAMRMSWREARKLATRLNHGHYEPEFFVRHLRAVAKAGR
jgi:hypothetical protein